MVGMLYRAKRTRLIYVCTEINFEHIAILTLVCVENGDRCIVTGLRNLGDYYELLVTDDT